MYFRLGGGTLKGVSQPGEIVWSRIYVDARPAEDGPGPGRVVELPEDETQRRWQATTPQWPIMHAVTYGVSRDQMMARHKSNHIQVVYANSADEADRRVWAKASMAAALGLDVSLCGTRARRQGVVITILDAAPLGREFRLPGSPVDIASQPRSNERGGTACQWGVSLA